MTRLIPIDPAARGGHRNVAEMTRELLADDPAFIEEFEGRLAARQLVTALTVVRARAGLSQKELAEKMGCGQPKISKLESGVDVAAYLETCGHAAKIILVPAGCTLVDQVKMHGT